ncbi:MAG TPA: type 4a pilus biogenesis protein PilO [Acidimicrobiales bacterium]|nr:type 4a pilus biogenesis protein PilO [Acidimicrobiales bacterium]
MKFLRRLKPRVVASGVGAFVVVLVVWYLALWSPTQRSYAQAQASAESSAASVQALQAQIAQLRSSQTGQGQAALKAKLATETAAIPAVPDVSGLIDQVNEAATQSGVTFTSISPAQPAASAVVTTGPPVIAVSLNVSGGYYQIIDFINRLDTMSRLMVILGVDLGAGGTTSELTATLMTDVFISKPIAIPTSATTTTTLAPTTTTTAAP